jgi:hypothetical protein
VALLKWVARKADVSGSKSCPMDLILAVFEPVGFITRDLVLTPST